MYGKLQMFLKILDVQCFISFYQIIWMQNMIVKFYVTLTFHAQRVSLYDKHIKRFFSRGLR